MTKSILIIIFLLFFPPCISALERFEIITTAELEIMLDQRKNGKIDFLLVNGLDRMVHNHTAIPGSINIPLSSFDEYAHKLGRNKEKLIIPY